MRGGESTGCRPGGRQPGPRDHQWLWRRRGNANLCSLIPDIELKLDFRCLPNGNRDSLTEVSDLWQR